MVRPEVGQTLPAVVRRLDLVDLVIYAAATWDWLRVHYDRDTARERGMPAPLVDGQMLGALMARQVTTWAGPRATVTRMSFRFRSPVYAGETVRCEGTVLSVEDGAGGIRATVGQRVLCGDRVAVEPAMTVVEFQP